MGRAGSYWEIALRLTSMMTWGDLILLYTWLSAFAMSSMRTLFRRENVMGVDQTHYVMLGIIIRPGDRHWLPDGLDVYEDCKWKPVVEGHRDSALTCVIDNMGGEYMVIGRVLAKGDEYRGIEFTKLKVDRQQQDDVTDLLSEFFQDAFIPRAELVAFTHWS